MHTRYPPPISHNPANTNNPREIGKLMKSSESYDQLFLRTLHQIRLYLQNLQPGMIASTSIS